MSFSRQYDWARRQEAARLNQQIPHDCPIAVYPNPSDRGLIVVRTSVELAPTDSVYLAGRYQVVAAYVEGFVRAWRLTQ